ncbi:hypothetical protein RchiOBHm_Chr1g0336681 [Rosa chinensis]|uniref:Uncharacterized protein n=1 Tax=Rosa chinensis TaxID=74649 RepID=A0A2P6SCQ3_ROSCH|nr:hypothetical protein RchiOBHm_Chr1g0336681 [Rosa chinensis]
MNKQHQSLNRSMELNPTFICNTDKVVLTTSSEWGAVVTKLNVPADWKEWQIYLLLLGLFLASAVAFYIFFEKSDNFWNFPSLLEKINQQDLNSGHF